MLYMEDRIETRLWVNGIQDRIGEVLDGVHYTEGQITTPRKTTAHGQSEAQHRHSLGH